VRWIIKSDDRKKARNTIKIFIISGMARGWESKSVEEQMESAKNGIASGSQGSLTDDEKKARHERDSLNLSRAYIVHQIEASTNERYTRSLQQALSELDEKLATLGNSH
jgi:hypothetical protein